MRRRDADSAEVDGRIPPEIAKEAKNIAPIVEINGLRAVIIPVSDVDLILTDQRCVVCSGLIPAARWITAKIRKKTPKYDLDSCRDSRFKRRQRQRKNGKAVEP